mgnify:CR=1 FL=1
MPTRHHRFSRRGLLKWIAGAAAIGTLPFLYYRYRLQVFPLGPPAVIPRSEWGAEEPDPALQNEGGHEVFNTVVVHHSAMLLSEGPRAIQYVHMHRRDFLDIGYHFVIDGQGRIYEGRSLAVHGAHVKGHNAGTLGIALMGNYEESEPIPEQLARLKWLIRDLMTKHPLTHLAGHSDFLPGKTLCPGKNLEPLLPALASELGLKFGTDGYIGPEPAPAALVTAAR